MLVWKSSAQVLCRKIFSLRVKYPGKRILMSKGDVFDAFRNVRIAPDQAQNFCNVWEMFW